MLVEHPDLEVEDGLADYAKPEMPGFYNTRMDRTDRNLVYTFARYCPERVFIGGTYGLFSYDGCIFK